MEEKLKEGVKFDGEKIRYDLIPADALHELARVYTHGAQKYEDDNWRKGMEWKKIMGAMERHYNSFKRGQEYDPDSGLLHIAQVAWGAFTLINFLKTHPELDTRVKDLPEGVDISKFDLAPPKESVVNQILEEPEIKKDCDACGTSRDVQGVCFVCGKQKIADETFELNAVGNLGNLENDNVD